jgi:hypothetical protein
VTELVLVLTNFSPPLAGGPSEQRPRLPLLEMLLSRSSRSTLPTDWRGWLAACAAPSELSAFSLAAIAGASFRGSGIPRPESTGYWLATPVHLFAGLDSVHLHPDGLLSLRFEEQEALVRDFTRVFCDSPWRLESIRHRELLLSGPQLEAGGTDPARLLGDDPSAGMPRGRDVGVLQRLGSEIEMWLYEHAINQERLARQELPVTALWLWGGEPPLAPAGLRALDRPELYGEDSYAESLWRLQGRRPLALSTASQAIQSVPMSLSQDSVVLLREGISHLEQHWLPGAVKALRQRRLSGLHLIAGTHLFSLSALRALQFWRRPVPWWEALT